MKPNIRYMSIAEVIAWLKYDTLSTESHEIILIRSQPHVEHEVPFVHDRQLTYSFDRKFQQGFAGWRPGDRLRAFFRVVKQQRPGETLLEVSGSVVDDSRDADSFRLLNLSTADQEALEQAGMGDMDATLLIQSKGVRRESNMFEYEARLILIHWVRPVFQGDFSGVKEHASLLLEGETVGYREGAEAYPRYSGGGYVQLRIQTGEVIHVTLWNGYLVFDGGNLPVLNPAYPMPGDRIQLLATFGNPGERYGRAKDPVLFAYWDRSAFLLSPGPERFATYQATRALVAQHLEGLVHLPDDQSRRQLVAQLVRGCLYRSHSGPELDLTVDELQTLRATIQKAFTNPGERPVDVYGDMHGVENTREWYGVDILPMNRAAFYQFCLGIAQGEEHGIKEVDALSP